MSRIGSRAHPASHSACCFIVPPHILRSIRLNGSPEQQRAALRTLMTDANFRINRATLGGSRAATPGPALIGAPPKPNRSIFDVAHGGQTMLPGTLVRAEQDADAEDPAVNGAFTSLGATFDFYLQVFQRNSIDGNGLPLDATVHFLTDYDNAFWNHEEMVFGDGDGHTLTNLTEAIDVVGHELTHGVTQYTCGLAYHDQPGALNESISDVFGSLVKQFTLRQSAEVADWLIGSTIFAPGFHGIALRSMKAPGTAFVNDPVLGTDPQPATMDKYVQGTADFGGVHINSGIPNHAFYIAAMSIGGNAWEAPGKIWYATLQDPLLTPEASFADFAARTIANAATLFGENSSQQQAVADAWQQVGVQPTADAAPAGQPEVVSVAAAGTASHTGATS